jgi:hypothetical protein
MEFSERRSTWAHAAAQPHSRSCVDRSVFASLNPAASAARPTDRNVSPEALLHPVAWRLLCRTPADMPLIDQDVPNRFSDLALYASLVATAVIAFNVSLVKLVRRIGVLRSRSRLRQLSPARRTHR